MSWASGMLPRRRRAVTSTRRSYWRMSESKAARSPARAASKVVRSAGGIDMADMASAFMLSQDRTGMNVNVTCWRSGPAATELELLTVRWIAEMLGYPASDSARGLGLLVSGGSMANFAGLAAARASKGSGVVYATEEAHFSIRKAARL